MQMIMARIMRSIRSSIRSSSTNSSIIAVVFVGIVRVGRLKVCGVAVVVVIIMTIIIVEAFVFLLLLLPRSPARKSREQCNVGAILQRRIVPQTILKIV